MSWRRTQQDYYRGNKSVPAFKTSDLVTLAAPPVRRDDPMNVGLIAERKWLILGSDDTKKKRRMEVAYVLMYRRHRALSPPGRNRYKVLWVRKPEEALYYQNSDGTVPIRRWPIISWWNEEDLRPLDFRVKDEPFPESSSIAEYDDRFPERL